MLTANCFDHKKNLLPQGQEGCFVEDEFCAISLEAGWTRGPRLAVSVDYWGEPPLDAGEEVAVVFGVVSPKLFFIKLISTRPPVARCILPSAVDSGALPMPTV